VAGARQAATDPTVAFFDDLASRGREPLLQKASGSTRFELRDGRKTLNWLVRVDRGAVKVSRQNVRADCVVRADKALFDQITSGRRNAVAAVLRGELGVQGDWRLLVRMQRLFPSPPRPRRRSVGS
jgi:putative sterol carrier protein